MTARKASLRTRLGRVEARAASASLGGLGLALLAAVAQAQAPSTAQDFTALVSRIAEEAVTYDPVLSYSFNLSTDDHSRFADQTAPALAAHDAERATNLKALHAMDPARLPPDLRAAYASLREQMEADQELRVCRSELWDVNHINGWINVFALVASRQPVGTARARSQALARWSSVGHVLAVNMDNLRQGLRQGYAAPRSVVRRVIGQLEPMIAAAGEASPFYSPAARDDDAPFRAAFARVLDAQVRPALLRYRDFLRDDYLPRAREGVAISDLPRGPACYQAYLRSNTTLKRSPKEVFDLGSRTVAANRAEVVALGKRLYGVSDFTQIALAAKARPDGRFSSKDELLSYSRAVLARAVAAMPRVIDPVPKQPAAIEPEPDFEDAAGVPSHYEIDPDPSKPGIYRIRRSNWATQTRGEAEITTLHELLPGHHLQIALSRELQPPSSVSKFIYNYAYVEGWARHAEAVSEELGLYQEPTAPIFRRVWMARGMVVDPGLHAFGWSRRQAIDYLVETGRFDETTADEMVDRIAVLPGQLTSYDTGGLEIMALRREAEAKLGARFSLQRFNRVVVEEGIVPLAELRAHVEAWVKSETG